MREMTLDCQYPLPIPSLHHGYGCITIHVCRPYHLPYGSIGMAQCGCPTALPCWFWSTRTAHDPRQRPCCLSIAASVYFSSGQRAVAFTVKHLHADLKSTPLSPGACSASGKRDVSHCVVKPSLHVMYGQLDAPICNRSSMPFVSTTL